MSDIVDNEYELDDVLKDDVSDTTDVKATKKEDVTFDDLEGPSGDEEVWEDSGASDDEFFYIKTEVEEKEETKEEDADAKIKEDLIEVLDGDTKVTIKGKQYDLKDLSAAEIKKRFQLAGRAYEIMQKSAEDSKDMARLIDQAVESKMRNLVQGVQRSDKTSDDEQSIPEFLKPQEHDTDEVKALKQSQALLLKEIGNLKQNVNERTDHYAEQQFVAEVERCKNDYPAASIDEVIAIKSLRPDIPTSEIMRASHEHYDSREFLMERIKANPELKRELFESAIKEYKAKVQKASGNTVPRRRSGGSVSNKVTTKTPRPIRTFDDIEARSGEIEALLKQRRQNLDL